MQIFKLDPTNETPTINFDPANNHFELSGVSLPEDARGFFEPVIKWWVDFANECNQTVLFEVKMIYFNTASSKCFLDLFEQLNRMKKDGKDITVKWSYTEGDDDMKSAGEVFNDLVELEFEFVEEEDDDDDFDY